MILSNDNGRNDSIKVRLGDLMSLARLFAGLCMRGSSRNTGFKGR